MIELIQLILVRLRISLYIMLRFTSSERNEPVLKYNGHQYKFKRQGKPATMLKV